MAADPQSSVAVLPAASGPEDSEVALAGERGSTHTDAAESETEQPVRTEMVDLNNTHQGTEISRDSGPPQNRERLRTPPPSYSVPTQPLFLPYITQDLPCYAEVDSTIRGCDYRRLGFLHHSGGQFTPVQIPGYIATDEPRNTPRPPVLQARHANTEHTHNQGIRRAQPTTRPGATPRLPAPSKDHLKMTFILLLICILHLNLPAVLFSLTALGFSIKTRELNARRMYRESEKYSRLVLLCDSLAVLEYVVIVVTSVTVLVLIFIFDFQLFQ